MKRVENLIKNKVLINTFKRFKIRSYLNKTLQKKRNRFFFSKYLCALFFLQKGFYPNFTVVYSPLQTSLGCRTFTYNQLFVAQRNRLQKNTFFRVKLLMFM